MFAANNRRNGNLVQHFWRGCSSSCGLRALFFSVSFRYISLCVYLLCYVMGRLTTYYWQAFAILLAYFPPSYRHIPAPITCRLSPFPAVHFLPRRCIRCVYTQCVPCRLAARCRVSSARPRRVSVPRFHLQGVLPC